MLRIAFILQAIIANTKSFDWPNVSQNMKKDALVTPDSPLNHCSKVAVCVRATSPAVLRGLVHVSTPVVTVGRVRRQS